MTTIFIKSFERDFKFLYYSLLSIQKYVTGNYDVVLMIDTGNILPEKINEILSSINARVYPVNLVKNGYLFQQYCKLSAFKYTNSEYILYSDSDCIFDKPVKVDEIFKDDKPEILYTDYSKVGDAICWKQPTEKFIGEAQEFEFMRRFPLTYHRNTIEKVYNYIPDILTYIVTSESFSEYNAIGAWAFKNESDKYNFVNTDNWEYVDPLSVQLWTHADKDGSQLQKDEYQRAVDTINKALELNINEL